MEQSAEVNIAAMRPERLNTRMSVIAAERVAQVDGERAQRPGVLILPEVQLNLYHKQLALGMAEAGASVEFSMWGWRLGLEARPGLKILHLHWLQQWAATPRGKFDIGLFYLRRQIQLFQQRGGVLIWTVHNLQNHENKHVEKEVRIGRMIARISDAVIVHSQYAVDPVCQQYRVDRSKIYVVPHPRYEVPAGAADNRFEARQRLKVDQDAMVYGFVGMIRPYKGVEELLEAFRRLTAPHVRLLIGGAPLNSNYKATIEMRMKDDERVTGWLERLDDVGVHDLFTASDVVVLPYRKSLTSGALVHAMSACRAVIGPDIGVFHEHIGTEGGFLYSPNHQDGLVDALHHAVLRQSELGAMGVRNRQLAKVWSPQAIGEHTMRIFEQVKQSRSI